MKRGRTKRLILSLAAILFSVLPPILATLLYFPIWQEDGSGKAVSGFTLILLLLALVPFFNLIRERLKTPSAHTLWFIIFITFFLLSRIAREMTVISFVGFIGNLIGAVLFKAARAKEEDGNEG